MGRSIVPNALTVSRGIAAVALVWMSDAFHHDSAGMLAALLVFTGSALTDLVDGPLARRLGATTAFGAFADPVADKMLYWSGFITMWRVSPAHGALVPVLIGIYATFAVYDAFTLLLRFVNGVMIPNRFAKWRTALLFVAVEALMLRPMSDSAHAVVPTALYAACILAATVLTFASAAVYAAPRC